MPLSIDSSICDEKLFKYCEARFNPIEYERNDGDEDAAGRENSLGEKIV